MNMADSDLKNIPKEPDVPDNVASSKKNKKKPVKKETKPTKDDIIKEKRDKKLNEIKEKLARQREEEERRRKEEEEEELRFQEEQRKLEEQKRLEAEKRERKKQKEKEKKQRLKDEGKFLTEKQKEDRRRALELAQARGLNVEACKGDIKNRTYSKKKKKHQMQETNVATPTDVIPEVNELPEAQVDSHLDILDDWEDLANELQEKEIGSDTVPGDIEQEFVEVDQDNGACESQPDPTEAINAPEKQLSEEDKRNLIEEAKARIEVGIRK